MPASISVDAPADDASREVAAARATISRCDQRLASYRAALDAMDDDGDPAVIARWISEATAERSAAQIIALGTAAGPPVASLTRADVAGAVATLGLAAQALTLIRPGIRGGSIPWK